MTELFVRVFFSLYTVTGEEAGRFYWQAVPSGGPGHHQEVYIKVELRPLLFHREPAVRFFSSAV